MNLKKILNRLESSGWSDDELFRFGRNIGDEIPNVNSFCARELLSSFAKLPVPPVSMFTLGYRCAILDILSGAEAKVLDTEYKLIHGDLRKKGKKK